MNYINGDIVEISSSYVVIDNNGIGYEVYTPNPYSFTKGNNIIYIYEKFAEDEHTLYGFKTKEEKELFLKLIDVKGLGPKMALPMLALGSIEGISDAIESENVTYLKKFPKIGDKVARQIILDLKGKLVSNENVKVQNSALIEALKSLGYKISDINKVITNIDHTKDIGTQIKEALKLMLK